MKNRILSSVAFVILGIFIVLGPTILFPVCNSEEMKMACYYTKQAEIGIGVAIVILGAIILFTKNAKIRIGFSIAQLVNAVLVVAYPLWLTGLCGMNSMACHVRALPALIVAASFTAIVAIINTIYLIREGQDE